MQKYGFSVFCFVKMWSLTVNCNAGHIAGRTYHNVATCRYRADWAQLWQSTGDPVVQKYVFLALHGQRQSYNKNTNNPKIMTFFNNTLKYTEVIRKS